MNDLTETTSTVAGERWILRELERIMAQARLSFKVAKSRCLVLKKGKVTDKFRFTLGEHLIPSVTEKRAREPQESLQLQPE